MFENDVVEVRATGRTPEAVTEDIKKTLAAREAEDWQLNTIQPIIYNSSTTGYLLLFFQRERRA
jgi:hypothetical protein